VATLPRRVLMRIDLSVPYLDRKLARKRGARWDAVRKTWWADTDWPYISKLIPWIDPSKPDYEPTQEEMDAMAEAEAEKLIGKMPKF
jgi:hypothetical protein